MGIPAEHLYGGLAILFCLFLTSASVFGFLRWHGKTRSAKESDVFYVLFTIEACIVFTNILHIYIVYLGIPTWLTFGYQIGKILPATCEDSMSIEGKEGLPCSLKRLLEWLERATGGSGSWSSHEFERDWTKWLVIAALVVGVNVIMGIFWQCKLVRERRAQALKESAENDADGLAMQEV